jgi:protein SCO1
MTKVQASMIAHRVLALLLSLFLAHVSAAEKDAANPAAKTDNRWQKMPSQIPDTLVRDQDGRQLKFYGDLVKNRTVAINFIFTSCTSVCPPLTAAFRQTQKQLSERLGRDVRLISISVDPLTDTPERLKRYAAKFDAAAGWSFVTGDKFAIDQLLKALGAYSGDKSDHTPLILIGNDKAGEWTRLHGLATPAVLVRTINEAAGKTEKESTLELPKNPYLVKVAEKIGDGKAPQTSAPAFAAKYFTNLPLLNQDNKPVRFYDDLIKGKIVLINVMFTNCTSVCSPVTANLARAQQYLGEELGRKISMISISVDPEHDTPVILKRFADKHGVKPGWNFITGKKENVDWILYKLGNYVEDKLEHSTILIVGNDATGDWSKMLATEKPQAIADAVKKLASPAKS